MNNMYTKEELESMKFRELKHIAKQKNISRRWTTKRELIDSLLSGAMEEDLDMITATLVESSDSDQENSHALESDLGEPVVPAQESESKKEPESCGVTRTGRRRYFPKPRMTISQTEDSNNETYVKESNRGGRRFPKPRMTVFQTEESNNDETYTKESDKGEKKYLDSGRRSRKIRTTENDKPAESPEIASVKKKTIKQLLVNYAESQSKDLTASATRETRRSTRNFTPRKIISAQEIFNPPSTNSRRMTRSTRNKEPKQENDVTFAVEKSLEEEEMKENVCYGRRRKSGFLAEKESLTEIQQEKPVSSQRQSTKRNITFTTSEEGNSSPDVKSISFVKENKEPETQKPKLRGRKRKSKYFKNDVKDVAVTKSEVVDISEDPSILESVPEKFAELNGTFEIEEKRSRRAHSSFKKPQQDGIDATYSELRRSVRRQTKNTPLRTRELNKTSTPKDFLEDKENEASDVDEEPSIQEISVMPEVKDISFSVVKHNESAENKRRSSSFPRETIKQKNSNPLFSPATKLISAANELKSNKKDTPLKNTRIPKFVKKMPNFGNIHKKEFEKMESVVENFQRKQQRAKLLQTPNSAKTRVMVFTAQPAARQSPLRKPLTKTNVPAFTGRVNVCKEKNPFLSPTPHFGKMIQKQNMKDVREVISKKLPVHNRRENIRQESRTAIRGVRLNRRFELQMAHRKMN